MDYLVFTYPNCPKCEALKTALADVDVPGEEFDLTQKPSKIRIRDFLSVLRRDAKGGIIIPSLILRKDGEVLAVLNSREELEAWLKSRG